MASRHEAKQTYKTYCEKNDVPYKQGQTVGVYSHATADAYRASGAAFCGWLREHHSEVKKLEDIQKEHAYEWLHAKEANGQSPYTISRDMAAINKVIGLSLSKDEGGLQHRSVTEITRSRGVREHDSHYNPVNYKEQIAVSQAFGVRRESSVGGQFQIKDVSFYLSAEGHVRVCVIEKGGKYREAPCLLSREEEIKAMYPEIPESAAEIV